MSDSKAETLELLSKLKAEKERRALKKGGIGTFMEFADLIGRTIFPMSPAQIVIAKVAFDGVQPSELTVEELPLFHKIFGDDVHHIPPEVRSQYISVCGARSGKTYLSAIRLLHLALTVPLVLGPGERPVGILIAPSLKLAQQGLNYIRGVVDKVPALKALSVGRSLVKLSLARDGHVIDIEPRAAIKQGTGGRGFSCIGCVMDESAFFRNSDFSVSDEDIFSAIYARLMPKAQMIVASTPWARQGLLWDKYKENWNHPVGALCAHAPTLTILPTAKNIEIEAQTRRDDPDKADNEYGAVFLSESTESFFDHDWIEASIDLDIPLDAPMMPEPGDEVKAGADFAFEGDSSTLVVGHTRDGIQRVGEICERKPRPNQPLMPSDVIRDFSQVCDRHDIKWVMADKHYRMSIIEHMLDYGLNFIDAPNTPSEAFVATRMMMNTGRIRIPNNARFIKQLKEVKATRLPGGSISIKQPRKRGSGHGDIVSAFVLMVFQLCGNKLPVPTPDLHTPEGREWLNMSLKENRRAQQIRKVGEEKNQRWWKTSPGDRSNRNSRFGRN